MSLRSCDEQAVHGVAKKADKVCWGVSECLRDYVGKKDEEASGKGFCGERGCFEERAILVKHVDEIGKKAWIG